MNEFPLFLIGGSGRSGSTVLSRIFSNHSCLTDFPESRFLIDADGLIEFYANSKNSWSPYIVDTRLKRLSRLFNKCGKQKYVMRQFTKLLNLAGVQKRFNFKSAPAYAGTELIGVNKNFLKYANEFLEEVTDFSYRGSWTGMPIFHEAKMNFYNPQNSDKIAEAIRNFYHKIAADTIKRQNKKYFFEKNTFCILFFDQILEIFPQAKLIHIYRDPRDVVSSYLRQPWSPGNPILAAKWYTGIMSRWFYVRDNVPENSYMEISLESLVRSPKHTLSDICYFWKIPFENSLMRVSLDKANLGRWKNDIDKEYLQKVNAILDPALSTYGYNKE